MIVVVGGIKGGTGKSTIASNLAVVRSAYGSRTLLVDADDQHSVSDWAAQRNEYYKDSYLDYDLTTVALSGKHIHNEIHKMLPDYDDVIVDAGGRDTTTQRAALLIANLYLVPFKPRSFDIWTMGKIKEIVDKAQQFNNSLIVLPVINQADSQGKDNSQVAEIMNDFSFLAKERPTLGNRIAFPNAASHGLSVCEVGKDQKAIEELMELYSLIYKD